MKVYRNPAYITKRETLGKRLFMVAVLSLAGGLMVSFTPNMPMAQAAAATNPIVTFIATNYAIISFATLIIGFMAASVGSYFINRFAPRRWPNSKLLERPDQVLARLLKGLDDRYTLFSWVFPGVSHLLVGPCGMVAFVVRSDKGQIRVQGSRWREPFTLARLFTLFAREGLGNPSREIEEYTREVQRYLQEGLADHPQAQAYAAIPVTGAVVFINPEVQLDLQDPAVPVLQGDGSVKFVQQVTRHQDVKNSLMRQFQRDLEARLAGDTAEDAQE